MVVAGRGCRACFRNLFDKRFKTNFVKGRKNKREHVRLLLAFSGGPSSRCSQPPSPHAIAFPV